LENVIEKSVQFRTDIRDIIRRKSSSNEENPKKLVLEQCDEYRLQMKYLGVEIKVLLRRLTRGLFLLMIDFYLRIDIKDQLGHLKNKKRLFFIFIFNNKKNFSTLKKVIYYFRF
jgi:hypothetical protein